MVCSYDRLLWLSIHYDRSMWPLMTRQSKQEVYTLFLDLTAGTEMGCPCPLRTQSSGTWSPLNQCWQKKSWQALNLSHRAWRRVRLAFTIPWWSMDHMPTGMFIQYNYIQVGNNNTVQHVLSHFLEEGINYCSACSNNWISRILTTCVHSHDNKTHWWWPAWYMHDTCMIRAALICAWYMHVCTEFLELAPVLPL